MNKYSRNSAYDQEIYQKLLGRNNHLAILGIVLHRVVVKSIMIEIIQGEVRATISRTEMTLGTKVKVCSWIWVTAWKRLTIKPTKRPTHTDGSEIISTVVIP